MDLKSIRDTELLSTKSEFAQWVLRSGIVKASQELKSTLSKNISKNFYSGVSQSKGFYAEQQVIKLLTKNNWNLVFQRLKTRIAEIDLILEKPDKILLVEVKTLNDNWRAGQRLSPKQIEKLKANRVALSFYPKKIKVEAYVAWVHKNNVITFCSID